MFFALQALGAGISLPKGTQLLRRPDGLIAVVGEKHYWPIPTMAEFQALDSSSGVKPIPQDGLDRLKAVKSLEELATAEAGGLPWLWIGAGAVAVTGVMAFVMLKPRRGGAVSGLSGSHRSRRRRKRSR